MPLPYHLLYSLNITPWHRTHVHQHLVDTVARISSSGYALDLGCGKGTDTKYLSLRGWDVVAIDMVPKAIDSARKACHDAPRPPQIILGNVLDVADIVPHLPYRLIIDNGCLFSLKPSQQCHVIETITSWCTSAALLLRFGLFTEETLAKSVPESWKSVWVDAKPPRYRLPGDPIPTWSLLELR